MILTENKIKDILSPFVSCMNEALQKRNNITLYKNDFFTDKVIDKFKKFEEFQLNNSSLDTKNFNITFKEKELDIVKREYDVAKDMINIIRYYNTNTFDEKLAICFSGGIDSVIALWYAIKVLHYEPQDILLISIDYKSPYKNKEKKAVEKSVAYINDNIAKISRKMYQKVRHIDFDISRFLNLEDYDEKNMGKGYIIPNRNAVFAAIGSLFSNNVWIVANYRKIDDEPGAAMDKNRKFFGDISEILSEIHERPITVTSPFLHLTKADTILWLYKAFGDVIATNILKRTVSCYDSKEDYCGKCYACFKQYVGLYKLKEHPDMKKYTLFKELLESRAKKNDRTFFDEYKTREIAKGRLIPEGI